ncbi:ABC transporter permease subunit [Paenibacillus sp. LMG 31459]|uniref:ABC transporter permease subunit n=1 Tax=Paenibacillus phytohabitans TaxID=2654978 RepID=A0ABX1YPC5_9BACL|nr:sugar ABC transporter permease [Paenibacillus phytohabitans]NOU82920.1 ABC transporter permease subunit [Paenibacillus phytohabitans]
MSKLTAESNLAGASLHPGSRRAFSRFVRKYGPAYLMLLVPVCFFAVFSLYPIGWALKYVFYYYDGVMPERFTGMANLHRLMEDQIYWSSLWKQALFSLKILIELPLAFVLALFLYSRLRGRNIFRAMFVMPYILPGSTMALVMYILLNPYNGGLNQLLLKLHLIDQPIQFLSGGWTAFASGMVMDAWQNFGINMLFFLVGLTSIPKDVYESADMDGATGWKRMRYISIPMMGRILQMILFLSILGTLKSMGPFLVLTNGGPNNATELTFLYIFHQFFGGEAGSNYGYGATVAVVTALMLVVVSVGYFKLTKRMDYHE